MIIALFKLATLFSTGDRSVSELKKWTVQQASELFNMPFFELLFQAQQVHRQHFDPQQIQVSTLLSIKTGACPKIANIVLKVRVIKPD